MSKNIDIIDLEYRIDFDNTYEKNLVIGGFSPSLNRSCWFKIDGKRLKVEGISYISQILHAAKGGIINSLDAEKVQK